MFRHTQCVFDQFGKALHIYSLDSEAKSDLLRIKPEIRRTYLVRNPLACVARTYDASLLQKHGVQKI